jgi:hypothetical protein
MLSEGFLYGKAAVIMTSTLVSKTSEKMSKKIENNPAGDKPALRCKQEAFGVRQKGKRLCCIQGTVTGVVMRRGRDLCLDSRLDRKRKYKGTVVQKEKEGGILRQGERRRQTKGERECGVFGDIGATSGRSE